MWEQILDLAIKNGLWAVLFLALLVYVLKDSNKREKKYQQTIQELTEHLGIVNYIKQEVEEVKQVVFASKKKTLNKTKNSNEKSVNTNENLVKTDDKKGE